MRKYCVNFDNATHFLARNKRISNTNTLIRHKTKAAEKNNNFKEGLQIISHRQIRIFSDTKRPNFTAHNFPTYE